MKAVSIRTVRLLAALAVAASGARLAAAGPAEGTGEAAASAELKLDALVNQALERNARLAALRARWEAMREMPAQAEALANPMFMYGGMDMTDGGRFPDTGEKRFSVSQKLPWFGKRGRRGALAAREAEIMRREYEAMALDVVMTAKERYFDLYAVHQSLAIVEAEIAVLKGMESIAETKYATGEASQQDVLKAQSEATMLKARLLELQARDVTSKAELNALLNRPADAPLGRALAGPERTFEGAGVPAGNGAGTQAGAEGGRRAGRAHRAAGRAHAPGVLPGLHTGRGVPRA
jgi:outer membrane protein TolC